MRRFEEIYCAQRSPEWLQARCGRLTSTGAAAMLTRVKSGDYGAGRRHLQTQLVLERLTGKPQDSGWLSKAMQDGIDREPDALLMYEAITGQIVERTGFLRHTELMAGASLDGHLGNFEVIVEAKCPMAATHLEYLRTGKVPGNYLAQITHQLWVTGAHSCDWLSYHPDFPDALQVQIVQVHRNELDIEAYAAAATQLLDAVATDVLALQTMTNLRGQLAASVRA